MPKTMARLQRFRFIPQAGGSDGFGLSLAKRGRLPHFSSIDPGFCDEGFMTLPIDEKLLEILACPICKTPVSLKDNNRLVCQKCSRAYPIREGIPVMLADEASFEGGSAPAESS